MSNMLNVELINNSDAIAIITGFDIELANIIKDWDPPKKNKIYKARYRYGDLILNQGKLQLPLCTGGTVDITASQIDATIKKDLSYSSFPIGFVVNNTTEVFCELDNRIVPLAIFQKGVPLGLFETLENERSFCFRNVWSVSAGARTAFMLPKISDKTYHNRIQRELGCESSPPRSPLEHVPVFVDIFSKTSSYDSWYVDILFFSAEWFEKDMKNQKWLTFQHYLYSYLLTYSSSSRYTASIELIWDYFSQALNKKKKRVTQLVFEKMKSLIISALGVNPLLTVAIDNTRGPFDVIQRVYKEIYQISSAPAIMVPCHVNVKNLENPAYFSLKHHNTFEASPNKSSESLITDQLQLYSVTNFFMELMEKGEMKLETTIIEDVLKSLVFNFYHGTAEKYNNILHTLELPKTDSRLCMQIGSDEMLDFAYTNTFLKTCVQIRKR